ncbi:multicopper oxidase family protein [Streptosporangium nondiastaticum]|uniref:multicopper oxidase family protein n=1 Tax=Streptosporangium nondiastaticum TaxID=35764 RepID=UPI0031F923E4
MTMSRRQALSLLGLGAALVAAPGCSLIPGRAAQPRLLTSTAALPGPFTVPLPIPKVAEPIRPGHYEFEQRETRMEILTGLSTPVWTYGGQFPGPTVRARSGEATTVRVINRLGVPTVLHLHGGHTPPEHDGFPTDLVQPGTARDYRFPLRQRAATLWYHDHRMDRTGLQVWRGLAGFFLVEDAEEAALPLPEGDRDIPLMICDRSFAEDGSMPYPAHPDRMGVLEAYMGGVLGDVILVNGAPWPELKVAGARYRLRLLNASNARAYELSLSNNARIVQIGSDGGLLTAPRPVDKIRLAPSERADVVVDFSGHRPGDHIELRNLAGEGRQAQIMRFTVDRDEPDDSRVPATLSRIERLDPRQAAVTREFRFTSGKTHHGTGWLINGKPFDPNRIDARPRLGDIEIWRISSDVTHPFHLHLVPFQVLSMGGEPVTATPEWKDTVEVRDNQVVEIITRFTGYRGRYVLHCHNLEHEDMVMMATFEVV